MRRTILAVLILVACGGQDGPVESVQSQFAVVRNSALKAWAPGQEWTIDTVPMFQIGTKDGPAETRFVEMGIPTLTPAGGVVVANGPENTFRVFSDSGSFLKAFGRSGAAAGDFSQSDLYPHAVSNDTIAIFEASAPEASLHYFSVGRGRLRSALLSVQKLPTTVTSVDGWIPLLTPGGTSVVVGRTHDDPAAKYSPELVRDTVSLLWTDSAMRVIQNLGTHLEMEHFRLPMTGEYGALVSEAEPRRFAPAFAGGLRYAADPQGRRLCIGDTRATHIDCVDRKGGAIRIYWTAVVSVITEEEVKRWRVLADSALRGRGPSSPQVLASVAQLKFVRARPSFDRMMLDPDLNVWLEMPAKRQAGSTAPRIFSIFSEAGKYLGDISVPASIDIDVVGGDRVAARATDNGAPVLRVYRIVKG